MLRKEATKKENLMGKSAAIALTASLLFSVSAASSAFSAETGQGVKGNLPSDAAPNTSEQPILNKAEAAKYRDLADSALSSGKVNEAIEYYESAAESGDIGSQIKLGDIYKDIKYKVVDLNKSIHYYEMAKGLGNQTAKSLVGMMKIRGLGTQVDVAGGVEDLEAAANSGNSFSLFVLGDLYSRGGGINIDGNKAITLLSAAASKGDGRALNRLGELYRDGSIVPKDDNKAEEYFERAKIVGNEAGAINFALAKISHPQLGVDGMSILRDLAEKGSAAASFRLGDLYSRGIGVDVNMKSAMESFETSSLQGNPSAFVRLGDMYLNGIGTRKDTTRAIELYTKASELGDSGAIIKLASMYIRGLNGSYDVDKGMKLLQEAASYGDAGAAYSFGDFFSRGGAVQVDGEAAVKNLSRAAELGSSAALVRLGEIFADGIGVQKDVMKAKQYFQKAVEKGESIGAVKLILLDFDSNEKLSFDKLVELAKTGNRGAIFALLDLLPRQGNGQSNRLLISLLSEVADSGDTRALLAIANIQMIMGRFKEAMDAYKKAIALGDSRAIVTLALLHLQRKLGPQSIPSEGISLLRSAANRGDEAAIVNLANVYLWGTGVPKNTKKALATLEEGGKNGSVLAIRQLVSWYRDGKPGLIKNSLVKASGVLERNKTHMPLVDYNIEKIGIKASMPAHRMPEMEELVDEINSLPSYRIPGVIGPLAVKAPNLYVLWLQKAMKKSGQYDGEANGRLTKGTISAFNQFCSSKIEANLCQYGPLAPLTVRAIVENTLK